MITSGSFEYISSLLVVHEKITELRWERAKGIDLSTQRRMGVPCRCRSRPRIGRSSASFSARVPDEGGGDRSDACGAGRVRTATYLAS
jgi:hypothetical protein